MFVDIYNTDKKYSVIYADPPWEFKTYSGKGKKKSAENHYHCMTKSGIEAIPVPSLADDNAVLFLWCTFPCLKQALDLIDAWGFSYKTCGFVWVKRNRKSDGWFWGLGYWTRANAELCLLATKGKPKRVSCAVHQICDARIMEHSRKPDEIRDRICKLLGENVAKIELFARQSVEGWDCWGDEAPKN